MVDDWAVKAATAAGERDRTRQLNLEENARRSHIKDHEGPALFVKLEAWIRAHAEQYNKIRGQKELVVDTSARKNEHVNELDSVITVHYAGVPQPLIITYVVSTHTLKYVTEFAHAELSLELGANDIASFHGAPSYGATHIEGIGELVLEKLMNPLFP